MIAKDIQFIEVFCADDEAIDLEFQTNNKNKANEIWLLSYYIKTHILKSYKMSIDERLNYNFDRKGTNEESEFLVNLIPSDIKQEYGIITLNTIYNDE